MNNGKGIKKTIIAFEGLDGVGKTTSFNTFLSDQNKSLIRGSVQLRGRRVLSIHFPTEGSLANKILNHEVKATNAELQRAMLANILEVLSAFYKSKYDVLVCDRFIFSNFLYSLDETLPEFEERISSMFSNHFDDYCEWRNKSTGIDAIHDLFDITVNMVTCNEDIRMKRIFEERTDHHVTETKKFQTKLKSRFEELMKEPNIRRYFDIPTDYFWIWTSK